MLAELATLKARLGLAEEDVRDDDLLTGFIALVSARFERECNRIFGRAADITEEFSGDETELRLNRYPVDSTGITKWELKSGEVTGWETQTGVDCLIRRNCVVSLTTAIGTWQQQLRITYSGGYVLPGATATAGQTELPDDLEQACIEQCAYLYQSKDRLGLVSVSGDGGSVSQFAQLDLLPSVKPTLKKYERWYA